MKTVVSINKSTVPVSEVKEQNIYASVMGGRHYKAQQIGRAGHREYAFVGLESSDCWANGSFGSLNALFSQTISAGYEIFEFTDFKEFVQWLAK